LDAYLADRNYLNLDERTNSVNDEDESASIDSDSENRDPYELLGFGHIAHFRTMRFLALSFLVMAIFMGFTGVLNLKASPQNDVGLSFSSRLSISNIETSHSTCIQ